MKNALAIIFHVSAKLITDSYSPYACKPGYCTPPYGNSINGTLHEVGIACIKDYPKCKAYQYSASRGYGHLCAVTTSSKSDDMEDYKSCTPPFGNYCFRNTIRIKQSFLLHKSS